MKARFLSHILTREMPVYGATVATMDIRTLRSMACGDSCNVSRLSLENHWGTHVDCPAHFFPDGRRVADYDAAEWRFSHPCVMDLPLGEGVLVTPEDVAGTPADADLLLIRTGFGRLRGSEAYSCRNPGIRPETGHWLRENRPLLRGIGFDFVSISSYLHRELGREAHRAFLDPDGPNSPLLIIEDMDLTAELTGLAEALVAPLRIEAIDSAPCTVYGFFR
jgi:kynurenine formamidase